MMASHVYMSSSLTGPASMPGGGSDVRVLYSLKRRLEAEDAMLCVRGFGDVGVVVGLCNDVGDEGLVG